MFTRSLGQAVIAAWPNQAPVSLSRNQAMQTDPSNYPAYLGIAVLLCLLVVFVVISMLQRLERRAKRLRLEQQRTAALSRYHYIDGTERPSN